MRECEKGYPKTWARVNIKTSIFDLQYVNHFCINFYATRRSSCTVKKTKIYAKPRKLLTLISHCIEALLYTIKIYPPIRVKYGLQRIIKSLVGQ